MRALIAIIFAVSTLSAETFEETWVGQHLYAEGSDAAEFFDLDSVITAIDQAVEGWSFGADNEVQSMANSVSVYDADTDVWLHCVFTTGVIPAMEIVELALANHSIATVTQYKKGCAVIVVNANADAKVMNISRALTGLIVSQPK